MAYPSTFITLQNAIISRLNLDATADLQAVKDEINLAYSQTVIETEALQTSGTKTLTAGTATYDLSTFVSTGAVVRLKAVYSSFGGVTSDPLEQLTMDQILRRRTSTGGVALATGSPTHYSLNGLNNLELWPTPSSADVLTLWYVYQPTALSADADVPAIPEPYATRCLTAGACWKLADITGDPGEYQAEYEGWIARFRQHLNRRKGGQPGAFSFYPEGDFPPHDPATMASGW